MVLHGDRRHAHRGSVRGTVRSWWQCSPPSTLDCTWPTWSTPRGYDLSPHICTVIHECSSKRKHISHHWLNRFKLLNCLTVYAFVCAFIWYAKRQKIMRGTDGFKDPRPRTPLVLLVVSCWDTKTWQIQCEGLWNVNKEFYHYGPSATPQWSWHPISLTHPRCPLRDFGQQPASPKQPGPILPNPHKPRLHSWPAA